MAGGVPYLQLDQRVVVYDHRVVTELNTNCHVVLSSELFFGQLGEDARFSYASVANDDQLEKGGRMILIVVLLLVEVVTGSIGRPDSCDLLNPLFCLSVHILKSYLIQGE